MHATDGGWWRLVVTNVFWIGAGELVVRGLKATQIVLLVRYLGPSQYGALAFAMSFVAVFGVLFDSGLVLTVTRELSRSRENEGLLGDAIALKSALGAAGAALIVAGSYYVTRDPVIRLMVMILGANAFLGEFVNLSYAVFRAKQRTEYECLIRVGQAVVMLAAIMWVLWRAPSPVNVCWAYLAAGIAALTMLLALFWPPRRQITLTVRWGACRRLMAIALPLALAGGVSSLYTNIDSVMLGWWRDMTVVGWYDAARRVIAYAVLPMSMLSLVLLPAFAPHSARIDVAFRRRWDLWSASMIALAAFAACVMIAGGDQAVEIIFGASFRPAGPVLRIMVPAVFLMYVYSPCYQALILFDRQKHLFWVLAFAVAVNAALNVAVIPQYGAIGAAWATVATHVFIMCGLFLTVARTTPIRPVNSAFWGALGVCSVSGAAAFLVMKAREFTIWTMVPLGGAVYVLCLLALAKARVASGWSWISAETDPGPEFGCAGERDCVGAETGARTAVRANET